MTMCGRFVAAGSKEEVFSETRLTPPGDWAPRYNIAPTQRVLAQRLSASGKLELTMVSWGLLPSWSHDASPSHRSMNARAETLELKPAFKEPFHSRRCLIVASGFYEWISTGPAKRPLYFRFREPLAFAGLWDRWQKNGAAPFESCAIITVMANDVIARVSDRMPAILGRSEQARWLDPNATPSQLHALLRPLDPRRLEPIHVSEEVNRSSNDYPSLLCPVGGGNYSFATERLRMTQ